MIAKPPNWKPEPLHLARYNGRHSSTMKDGYVVRVVGKAAGDRTLVEAIGRTGRRRQFAVKTENLGPVPAGLFDDHF